jgi:hypothetical protein
MSNTEQQGQPGQEHQGQKPYQPAKTEGDRSPQPGKDKDKGTAPRTPDSTGGSQQPKPQR